MAPMGEYVPACFSAYASMPLPACFPVCDIVCTPASAVTLACEPRPSALRNHLYLIYFSNGVDIRKDIFSG